MPDAPVAAPLFSSDAPLYQGTVTEPVFAPPPAGAMGTAAPAVAPTGKIVNVFSPDGRLFGIDEAHLEDAKSQGYRPETPQEAGAREYLAKNPGASGALKIAIRKIANVPFGGAPDAIEQKTGINATKGLGYLALAGPMGLVGGAALGAFGASQVDPYDKAQIEALERAHPVANILGTGIGTVSGAMLFGGAAGKVGGAAERLAMRGAEHVVAADLAAGGAGAAAAKAAPTLTRMILGSAAKYGGEGVVFAAPEAITEAALGHPDHAAETLLWSGGLGAVIGGAGKVVGAGLAKAKTGFEAAGGWAKIADDQAIKSFGFERRFNKSLENLPGGAKTAAGVARREGLIGTVGESVEEHLGRVKAWTEGKRDDLMALAGKFETAGPVIDTAPVYKKITSEVLEPLSKMTGHEAETAKVHAWLESFTKNTSVDALAGGDVVRKKLTIGEFKNELNALEAKIRKDIPTFNPESIRKEFRQIEAIYLDTMDKGVEAAAAKIGAEDAAQAWRQTKVDWQVGHKLEQGLTENVARGQTNRYNGLGDRLKGMVGAGVGGLVGGPLGAIAGDVVGNQLARFTRMNGNAIAARVADVMAGGAAHESGILTAAASLKKASTELDNIPTWLSKIGSKEQIETLPAGVLTRLVGGTHTESKIDKHAAFASASDRLTNLAADPTSIHETLSEMVAPMAHDAPSVAMAMIAKVNGALAYLHQTMPKDPNPPQMYGGSRAPWKPSDKELSDWTKRVAVVEDPFLVFRKTNVSAVEIETLKAVYPLLYNEMVKRVAMAGMNPDAPKLSYQQRIRVGQLIGKPIDPSVANVAAYQGAMDRTAAGPEGGPPPGGSGGPSGGPTLKLPNVATDTQRILGR